MIELKGLDLAGDVVDETVLGHRPQRVAPRTAHANEFPATMQLEREAVREQVAAARARRGEDKLHGLI